jgi:DNA helicase-2/ATP-dependent DNA helicase PcrA
MRKLLFQSISRMRYSNRVTLAVAGSGKTSSIAREVARETVRRTALVTYTNNGCENLKRCCFALSGEFQAGIVVQSWYSFVLVNFVRPYQNCLYEPRVSGINFQNIPVQQRRVPKVSTARYYFSSSGLIWRDRVTEFACAIIQQSRGLSVDRIRSIVDLIAIDEAQDLAGWDLELIEILLLAGVPMRLVGDPRQSTFSTNFSQKNKRYRGTRILEKFMEWKEKGLVEIEYSNKSFRCVKQICEFANSLYEGGLCMESANHKSTDHDGVVLVQKSQAIAYCERFSPQVLRYDRSFDVPYGSPMNFGESKGLTFERVLIIPHKPLHNYLRTGDLNQIMSSREKVYVAITRAKQSVAFLVPDGFTSPVVQNFVS